MKSIFALALLLTACGPTAAASNDAGPPAPPATARDAGDGKWCGLESQSCLADGWEFDSTGHCCISRQTCKGRDAGTTFGFCEY